MGDEGEFMQEQQQEKEEKKNKVGEKREGL